MLQEIQLAVPVTEPTKKKPKARKMLPDAQHELADVAVEVAGNYSTFYLELDWVSKTRFTQMVTDFSNDVNTSKHVRSVREPITLEIRTLMKEMDTNLAYLKNAMSLKFGSTGRKAHYHEFGLELYSKSWKLTPDYNKRVRSLEYLLQGLVDHNIGNFDYGTAYWQDMYNRFKTAYDLSQNSDAIRSVTVVSKNLLGEEIREVLNALIHLVKAAYPKTYKARLREWGFRKEKY